MNLQPSLFPVPAPAPKVATPDPAAKEVYDGGVLLADLRGLSLLQPYASAIVGFDGREGPKRIENRERSLWTPKPGGAWVCIHASKGWYRTDLSSLWPDQPRDPSKTLPRSCIVGVARIVSVKDFAQKVALKHRCSRDEALQDHESEIANSARDELGAWAFGPVCYIVSEAHQLSSPIPCSGAMGLWRVRFGTQAEIEAVPKKQRAGWVAVERKQDIEALVLG